MLFLSESKEISSGSYSGTVCICVCVCVKRQCMCCVCPLSLVCMRSEQQHFDEASNWGDSGGDRESLPQLLDNN